VNPMNPETCAQEQACLKHAIEEIGALENFLPQLYEREAREPICTKRNFKTKRGGLK
jgi:hypothetical protein